VYNGAYWLANYYSIKAAGCHIGNEICAQVTMGEKDLAMLHVNFQIKYIESIEKRENKFLPWRVESFHFCNGITNGKGKEVCDGVWGQEFFKIQLWSFYRQFSSA